MIIDDKHAARAFLLDRPLAAPVSVLWNGPPFFRQRSLAGGSNGGVDHEDCGVIFREDGYTNRGDNAPRNIFSLIAFALKFLKSISPSPARHRTISGRQEQDTSPVLRLNPHPFC
jgi:hypothetical protein